MCGYAHVHHPEANLNSAIRAVVARPLISLIDSVFPSQRRSANPSAGMFFTIESADTCRQGECRAGNTGGSGFRD